MKGSIIEMLMLSFIKQGLKINTIRAKMRRFASQSSLCKMYRKLVEVAKTSVKRVAVQFKGKNYVSTKKVGTVVNGLWFCKDSLLSGSRLDWFVNAGYCVTEI